LNYRLIIVILLGAIAINCETNSTEPNRLDPLVSTWSETFSWWQVGSFMGDSGETKTATLGLGNGRFTLKILPSHRVFVIHNDSITIADWPDTSCVGEYSILGDTLSLIAYNHVRAERFIFSINQDTLRLFAAVITDSLGNITVPLRSIIWGYSDLKLSGSFVRVRK
jgi:hypothetical protein